MRRLIVLQFFFLLCFSLPFNAEAYDLSADKVLELTSSQLGFPSSAEILIATGPELARPQSGKQHLFLSYKGARRIAVVDPDGGSYIVNRFSTVAQISSLQIFDIDNNGSPDIVIGSESTDSVRAIGYDRLYERTIITGPSGSGYGANILGLKNLHNGNYGFVVLSGATNTLRSYRNFSNSTTPELRATYQGVTPTFGRTLVQYNQTGYGCAGDGDRFITYDGNAIIFANGDAYDLAINRVVQPNERILDITSMDRTGSACRDIVFSVLRTLQNGETESEIRVLVDANVIAQQVIIPDQVEIESVGHQLAGAPDGFGSGNRQGIWSCSKFHSQSPNGTGRFMWWDGQGGSLNLEGWGQTWATRPNVGCDELLAEDLNGDGIREVVSVTGDLIEVRMPGGAHNLGPGGFSGCARPNASCQVQPLPRIQLSYDYATRELVATGTGIDYLYNQFLNNRGDGNIYFAFAERPRTSVLASTPSIPHAHNVAIRLDMSTAVGTATVRITQTPSGSLEARLPYNIFDPAPQQNPVASIGNRGIALYGDMSVQAFGYLSDPNSSQLTIVASSGLQLVSIPQS